ncbi:ABC transporter ATP-binding protein [Collinsella tanakaei]|uniref:ABC transporter ATP-binding protein n=1 Tax=Collinsella tanakaei TaxID=626935 RepID=UPI0025A36437|nr:ABC transporter ATP-binding protein [Collinsella tanakaei]MDM8300824.1 ABC transporter ATP-binding protein [Collinsella tanakaei]
MAQLEVERVSVAFDGVQVLDDVSLTVASGHIVCLLGPSGCGKTTLFHVVAGLSLPDAGHVLLDGRDITGEPGQLAYMLQKDLLLPEKTIADNVALPLVLRGVPRDRARAQALELFDTFGLAGTADRWPAELSGGMRQRAALLRSYLFSQEFMLLDEPFSALDAFTKADMHAWFLDVAERFGTTALVVTHDVDEALELADEIFVMRGAPQAGQPTRIVGSERIACPRVERTGFALTEEFLEHKRRVLALLG